MTYPKKQKNVIIGLQFIIVFERLNFVQYGFELSCMELGTGLGRNWDGTGSGTGTLKQGRDLKSGHNLELGSSIVPSSSPVPVPPQSHTT